MVSPNRIKRYDWTLSTPNSVSGVLTSQYTSYPINGALLGWEIGSPAFLATNGSIWLQTSGGNQDRILWQWNTLPQTRTAVYPRSQLVSSANGTAINNSSGNIWVEQVVGGEVLSVAGSGCFSGTNVPLTLFYQT